ncbi:MAG: hypothetical protein NXH75_09475, partial [Halobacteriovoraceae bacterium]|nr:hypothetical protein [Halobacteriovoraceae bacterium]
MNVLLLLLIGTIFGQSIVGDNWKIDPETYEEIVVTTIDAEVNKYKKQVFSKDPVFGATPLKFKSKKDYSKLLKEMREKRRAVYNRKKNERPNLSWEEKALKNQENWILKKKKERDRWIKDKQKILEKWRETKEKFRKDLPKIKRSLIPAKNIPREREEKDLQLPGSSYMESELKRKVRILSQTFHITIKHQGERSTCAAFAAVRGIEIKLQPEKQNYSEQFFFFLSRPECQKEKCSLQGSWARKGLLALKSGSFLPMEKNCSYSYEVKAKNITHIPQNNTCYKGKVAVKNFTGLNSIDQIQDEIKSNNPVVAGFYVDNKFLENDGFVNIGAKKKTNIEKRFAHTVLLLGTLPLPKEIQETEGEVCHIAVNSWGSGWGIGGYSCLTKKWVEAHIIPNKPLS